MNQRIENALEHSFGSLQHLVVPKPNYAKSATCQNQSALEILERMIRVLSSIDLDNQSRSQADEVSDMRSNRHLPPESIAAHPSTTQVIPKTPLSIG